MTTINRLLKQAARLILDKDYNNPSAELYSELQWVTFPETAHYHQALLVYRSLNNPAPPYMRNIFQYVKDVCSNNLRSAANLKLYVPKTHPKSIRFSGPSIRITYYLMQDQPSLYVILSGFTKRTTKISNQVISDCTLCIIMLCSLLCA